MKISIGDRVKDDYLGEGEVVSVVKNLYGDDGAYMVLFDKTPPIRYNMGQNPTLMFDIEKIGQLEAIGEERRKTSGDASRPTEEA